MTIMIYACGHYSGTMDGDSLFEQIIQYNTRPCEDSHCQAAGIEAYLQYDFGDGSGIRERLCNFRRHLEQLTISVANLLEASTRLPNRLQMADFCGEQDQRLGTAFVAAQTQPFDAVFELFPQLEWAQEVVLDEANAIVDYKGPAGFVDAIEEILESIIGNVDRNLYLVAGAVNNIARMQHTGLWELQTYDPNLDEEDLALLRRAGEAGAKALAAPITLSAECNCYKVIRTQRQLESEQPMLAGSMDIEIQDADHADSAQPNKSKSQYSPARYCARINKVLAQKRLRCLYVDVRVKPSWIIQKL